MLPDDTSVEAETGSTDVSALVGVCPLPLSDYQEVVLAHGSGGKLSQQLIQKVILPQFRNEFLEPLHDGGSVIEVMFRSWSQGMDSQTS